MATYRQLTGLVVLAAFVSAGAYAQSADESADDAQIRDKVQQQIDAVPSLRFDNISVQTADHVVYLGGLVDTRVDVDEAARVAASVPGVTKVYNDLAVMGG